MFKKHQEKYYMGCKDSSKYSGYENDINFYEQSKKISRNSIKDLFQNMILIKIN